MENSIMRSIVVDKGEINYCLERKTVKNLNLRIRKDGNVFVSANNDVPLEEIDEFVRSKSDYVLASVKKFEEMAQCRPQPKQYVSGESFYVQGRALRLKVSKADKDRVNTDGVYIFLEVKDPDDFDRKHKLISRFLNKQCKLVFEEVIDELYPAFKKYGVDKPMLKIRDMETRWGSCLAKKGIITLNKRLLEAPRNCIEYVVMHELCHFIQPNHSKHFYSFLTMLMPDWKERKALLEKTAAYWL